MLLALIGVEDNDWKSLFTINDISLVEIHNTHIEAAHMVSIVGGG